MRKLLSILTLVLIIALSQATIVTAYEPIPPENFPSPPDFTPENFPEFSPYLENLQPIEIENFPPIPTIENSPWDVLLTRLELLENIVFKLEWEVEQLADLAGQSGELHQQASQIFKEMENQIISLQVQNMQTEQTISDMKNQILSLQAQNESLRTDLGQTKILLLPVFVLTLTLIGIAFWRLRVVTRSKIMG
jgi:hypothetical protein